MRQFIKKKQLVGILNCTPDSYCDVGRHFDTKSAIEHALSLFRAGADVVDIGGESTRPGADVAVTIDEELARVMPVIEGIRARCSLPLSIDTFKPEVAAEALKAGVNWVNDITGLKNPRMRALVKEYEATCCVMHMYGEPHSQPHPHYPKGVVQEIFSFFEERIATLTAEGIAPEKIILDPGIGGGAFGKTPLESLSILKHVKKFTRLGFPILISLSRKSFLQKILQKPASELLSTTLALNTMALLEGATYIRVHDVEEHHDILKVLDKLDSVD